MKTLICGFGSIGRRHLNNLRILGETDFVLLRTHHSTLPEAEIEGIPFETEIQTALLHKPDAVVIANPTALHLDVAIPAAEAGCSILMEKPVSDSMSRIDDLEVALGRGGGKFLTGFQFRYHPGLRQVKRWLDANTIGKVTSFKAHWGEYLPAWHPWEDYRKSYSARPELGGGVINTLSHPLDYTNWLFGEARSVLAQTSSIGLGLPVEDTADILMRYETGLCGNVHLDYIQRPAEHTLQVSGTERAHPMGQLQRYGTEI